MTVAIDRANPRAEIEIEPLQPQQVEMDVVVEPARVRRVRSTAERQGVPF